MVERRPLSNFVAHLVLILGLVIVAFPVYLTFVASTSTTEEVSNGQMGLLPGPHGFANYYQVLFEGTTRSTRRSVIFSFLAANQRRPLRYGSRTRSRRCSWETCM